MAKHLTFLALLISVGAIAASANGAVITKISTSTAPFPPFPNDFTGGARVVGDVYAWTDNTGFTWGTGAGRYQEFFSPVDHFTVSGSTITYTLATPVGSTVFHRVDFDGVSGRSASGTMISTAPITLVAALGSKVATSSGLLQITDNSESSNAGSNYIPFAAPVNSLVPFSVTYTLVSGTWSTTSFVSGVTYSMTGTILVPEPPSAAALGALLVLFPRRRSAPRPLTAA
jgi:hypothetical protein